MISVEGGTAEIHRPSSDGGALGLRLARVLGEGRLRLDAGLLGSGADEGFVVLDAGVEARLCARCTVAPFVGGGIGFLAEPEFTGAVLCLNAGLELHLGDRTVLRVGLQRATHGGRSGPHLIRAGVGYRFGGR
jgi:hypothetical protein